MLKNVQLNIDYAPLLAAEYDSHEGSCIRHQVHELTDIHEQFGGFPDSYVLANTRINQLWWTDQDLDFQDIGQQLGMEVITVSSIRQRPGCVIPWHRDTFYQINQRFPQRQDLRVRANIFMQDWKTGHIIQYDETVVSHWRQGQGLLWDSEVLHLGANVGMQDKFTLQISGFLLTST
jgi:hypothetical protein